MLMYAEDPTSPDVLDFVARSTGHRGPKVTVAPMPAQTQARCEHCSLGFTVQRSILWPHPAAPGDLLILYPYQGEACVMTAEEMRLDIYATDRARPFENSVDAWRGVLRMLVDGTLQSSDGGSATSLLHWVREAANGAAQVGAREGAVLLLARTALISPVLAQPGDVLALYREQPAELYRRCGEEWRQVATGGDHDVEGIRDLIEREALVPLSDWHAQRIEEVAPFPLAVVLPRLRMI